MKNLIRRKKIWERIFTAVSLLSLVVSLLVFLCLVGGLASSGLQRIDPAFFLNFPSRFAGRAGILEPGKLCRRIHIQGS